MPDRSQNDEAEPLHTSRRPEPDSFDKPHKLRRVGVHRAPKKRGSTWMRVLWVGLATVALTAIGIIFVVIGPENLLFPQGNEQSQQATSTEEAKQVRPKIDPATTITVLNGTTTVGLGEEVAELIRSGQLGTVEYVGNTEDQNATISAVFYTTAEDEAVAKGLGEKLGGIFYYLREEYASYGTQLIVLIGSDYKGATAKSSTSSSE